MYPLPNHHGEFKPSLEEGNTTIQLATSKCIQNRCMKQLLTGLQPIHTAVDNFRIISMYQTRFPFLMYCHLWSGPVNFCFNPVLMRCYDMQCILLYSKSYSIKIVFSISGATFSKHIVNDYILLFFANLSLRNYKKSSV